MTETEIQITIAEKFSSLALKHNFVYYSIPNEGAMKTAGAAGGGLKGAAKRIVAAIIMILKKMGMTPGMPDMGLAYQGRAYFLEVKRPGQTLTGSQPFVIARLRECGCLVEVVHSLDEALYWLTEWGIIS